MIMARLSRTALDKLAPSVRRPRFDPAGLTTGIVHLGIGAFARAHLAWYTQPLLTRDPHWGIAGVSLRSQGTRDALKPQDWLYSCLERDTDNDTVSVMAGVTGVFAAPGNRDALQAMTDPNVRIVSISVSEKGYHRRAVDGALDENDPLIQADLRSPESPSTVPGLIVAALKRRLKAGSPLFTVMCCDNLPENGASTRSLVASFAYLVDPTLARTIQDDVAFPNSMVDRIVPATTDDDRGLVERTLGVHDAWPVVCEPFSQWVLEDRFSLGRPAWEQADVEIVDNVRPYETMKLRLLNGSHSAIAYLGQLAGWTTVSDAIAEQPLADFIHALMTEAASTLRMPASTDVAAYQSALLRRFSNKALRHCTAQIAIDGSQKIPMRLLGTAQDRNAAGLTSPSVAMAVAAWLRFLQGRSEQGGELALDDPKKSELTAAVRPATTPVALCDAVFALRDIVPPALAATSFRREVVTALETLTQNGVRKTLMKINQGEKRHEIESSGLSDGIARGDVPAVHGSRRAWSGKERTH
jgi:fructuronate reductase